MNKYIFISLVVILILSITANVYFVKKYDEKKQVPDNSKDEYLLSLEKELATVKETLSNVSNNTDKNITVKKLQDSIELETTAITFLEYVYNVNPDNFAYVKNKAREVMSKELFEVFYSSSGIDSNKVDYATEVSDIEVYQNAKAQQAIVKYKIYTKQLSTNYETEEQYTMCLYFETKNNKLIVKAIEPLTDMGAI